MCGQNCAGMCHPHKFPPIASHEQCKENFVIQPFLYKFLLAPASCAVSFMRGAHLLSEHPHLRTHEELHPTDISNGRGIS